MAKLVQVESGHGPVLFEVDDISADRTQRISRDGKNITAELDERLDSALASARPAAQAILDSLAGLGPQQLEVEFGVKIDAEAGAIIAKTGISGHFTIKVTWQQPDNTPATS
jgi:hypothetical protein